MEFKTSYDVLTKWLSIGISIIFISVALWNLKSMLEAEGDWPTLIIHFGVFSLLTFILGVSFVLSTKSYSLNSQELIIKKQLGTTAFPVADIYEARIITKDDMKGTIRTFGSGGLFGYYGLFYNRTLGSFTMYTTQRTNTIFIKLKDGKKIIISPDDVKMLDLLKSYNTNIK